MLGIRVKLLFGLVALVLALSNGTARAQDQGVALYMVEQAGCIYCARWDAEVGDAYHLTAEGRAAPLRRINLRADPPEGVVFARPAVFTPTFVLVQNGQEIARLEGYPGEDFFWPLLSNMLKTAGIDVE